MTEPSQAIVRLALMQWADYLETHSPDAAKTLSAEDLSILEETLTDAVEESWARPGVSV